MSLSLSPPSSFPSPLPSPPPSTVLNAVPSSLSVVENEVSHRPPPPVLPHCSSSSRLQSNSPKSLEPFASIGESAVERGRGPCEALWTAAKKDLCNLDPAASSPAAAGSTQPNNTTNGPPGVKHTSARAPERGQHGGSGAQATAPAVDEYGHRTPTTHTGTSTHSTDMTDVLASVCVDTSSSPSSSSLHASSGPSDAVTPQTASGLPQDPQSFNLQLRRLHDDFAQMQRNNKTHAHADSAHALVHNNTETHGIATQQQQQHNKSDNNLSSQQSVLSSSTPIDLSCHCLVVDEARVKLEDRLVSQFNMALALAGYNNTPDSSSSTSSTSHSSSPRARDIDDSALREFVCTWLGITAQDVAVAVFSQPLSLNRVLHIQFHSFEALSRALSSNVFLIRCGSAAHSHSSVWTRGAVSPCGPPRSDCLELLQFSCFPTQAFELSQLQGQVQQLLMDMQLDHTSFWFPSSYRNSLPKLRHAAQSQMAIKFFVLPRHIHQAHADIIRLHRKLSLFGGTVSVQGANQSSWQRCGQCDALGHQQQSCPLYAGIAVRLLMNKQVPFVALKTLIQRAGARSGYLGGSADHLLPHRVVTLLFDGDVDQPAVCLPMVFQKLHPLLKDIHPLLHEPPHLVNVRNRVRECKECGSAVRPHQCPFATLFPMSMAKKLQQQGTGTGAEPAQATAKDTGAQVPTQPPRPAAVPRPPPTDLMCKSWRLHKSCPRQEMGRVCRFQHPAEHVPEPRLQPLCRVFTASGLCPKGATCAFRHDRSSTGVHVQVPQAAVPPSSSPTTLVPVPPQTQAQGNSVAQSSATPATRKRHAEGTPNVTPVSAVPQQASSSSTSQPTSSSSAVSSKPYQHKKTKTMLGSGNSFEALQEDQNWGSSSGNNESQDGDGDSDEKRENNNNNINNKQTNKNNINVAHIHGNISQHTIHTQTELQVATDMDMSSDHDEEERPRVQLNKPGTPHKQGNAQQAQVVEKTNRNDKGKPSILHVDPSRVTQQPHAYVREADANAYQQNQLQEHPSPAMDSPPVRGRDRTRVPNQSHMDTNVNINTSTSGTSSSTVSRPARTPSTPSRPCASPTKPPTSSLSALRSTHATTVPSSPVRQMQMQMTSSTSEMGSRSSSLNLQLSQSTLTPRSLSQSFDHAATAATATPTSSNTNFIVNTNGNTMGGKKKGGQLDKNSQRQQQKTTPPDPDPPHQDQQQHKE